jgi:putative acetyltransferase
MEDASPHPLPVLIRREDPTRTDVVAMLLNGEAHSARLYPAESNHHLPLSALIQPHVRFFVARHTNGRAVGTGAVVLHDDWAEIKRMWVEEDARGLGVARQILNTLMEEARRAGAGVLRLETGVVSHSALALYETAGFRRREPFGDHRPDPLSVFMEKRL